MVIKDDFRIAVIVGSIRKQRFGPIAANWFATRAGLCPGVHVDLIDLAEARLPEVRFGHDSPEPRAVRDLAPWLDSADAFVIVTPEYNGSFPASVKNAIDWYRREWAAKPVGFVSYGGPAGGLRAVEQLRQVFANVGAVTIRDTVSLQNHRERFDVTGRPADTDACNLAAKRMLDELMWWAAALRSHRMSTPYAA